MEHINAKKNTPIFVYYYSKMKKFNKFHDLSVVKKLIKNWQDVILFRIGIKKQITIHLRTKGGGDSWKVNNTKDYEKFWYSKLFFNYLKEKFKNRIKIKNNIMKIKKFNQEIGFYFKDIKQFLNTLGLIEENFISEQYKDLDVKNKIVIDIGANIGDTAIYFALKGAKHVYAFEPYPYSYNLAQHNIKTNKLQNKITILNEGCGGESNKIRIKQDYKNYGGTDLKEFKNGKIIPITTLGDIMNRFKINNAVLKVDCEGCEYGIILKSKKETLRKFKSIMIEAHYGYVNLEKKLKNAGFTTNHTIPTAGTNQVAENQNMVVNIITSKRL